MAKTKYRFSERIRYAFDNIMSRGPAALIGWLALITLLIILVLALAAWIAGALYAENFPDQLWRSLMYTIALFDPTEGYDWGARLALFLMLIVGIFATSTLIGLLTTGIEDRIGNLRKGRSRVIEKEHTVILGWHPMIFPVVSELIKANTNRKKACIVILADKDKVEMEEEIAAKITEPGHTRLVCRTGSPMEISDLAIAGIDNARSIILLPPLEDPSDAGIIKTLLAITKNPDRQNPAYNIVAEINDRRNLEVARIISSREVQLISAEEFISRIMAQTCHQSGLSVVYTELFQFAGDEIYLKNEPALNGATFRQALFAYAHAAVIGVASAAEGIRLNPPPDYQLSGEDQIIAITEDLEAFVCSPRQEPEQQSQVMIKQRVRLQAAEKILILGWNRRALIVISELDNYLPKGSQITVITEQSAGIPLRKYRNIKKLEVQSGDPTCRNLLESLDLAETGHIILLPATEQYTEKQADARTLCTLLHLRDLSQRMNYTFSIVSEMLDVRNRRLAEADRPDDFVVSGSLVSMVLAQISENTMLAPIYAILLNPGGVEIYLRPAGRYLQPAQVVNFYTLVEAASQQGEIAIGYRITAEKSLADKKYGVYLNPLKSAEFSLAAEDQVIVIAEA